MWRYVIAAGPYVHPLMSHIEGVFVVKARLVSVARVRETGIILYHPGNGQIRGREERG